MTNIFGTWCLATTCHGFSYLWNSNTKMSKIFWALLIVACIFPLIQQVTQLIGSYFAGEQRWTTTVYENRSDGLPIPWITVCNYNRIKKSQAEKYGFDEELRIYFFKTFYTIHEFQDRNPPKTLREKYTKWRKSHNLTFRSILEKMAPQCDETFLLLSYGGQKAHDICNSTMEKQLFKVNLVFDAEFGLCHQIVFSPLVVATMTGNYGKASMILNPQTTEYLDQIINNYQEEGFAIQLNYNGRISPGSWIFAAPGYRTSIAIQRTETKTRFDDIMDKYDMPCEKEPKMPIRNDQPYQRIACIFDCSLYKIVMLCQCYPVVDVGSDKYPICEIEEFDDCIEMVSNRSTAKEHEETTQKCFMDYCRKPCHQYGVDSRISAVKYPTDNQKKQLNKHLQIPDDRLQNFFSQKIGSTSNNYKKGPENLVAVDLFYQTLRVKVTESFGKTTLNSVVSNLGGQLGLWLGASIITLVHLLTSIFHGIYTMLTKTNEIQSDRNYKDKDHNSTIRSNFKDMTDQMPVAWTNDQTNL